MAPKCIEKLFNETHVFRCDKEKAQRIFLPTLGKNARLHLILLMTVEKIAAGS